MRLRSALIGACFLPPFTVALGWVCEKSVHISVLCIMQFACGFFSMYVRHPYIPAVTKACVQLDLHHHSSIHC